MLRRVAGIAVLSKRQKKNQKIRRQNDKQIVIAENQNSSNPGLENLNSDQRSKNYGGVKLGEGFFRFEKILIMNITDIQPILIIIYLGTLRQFDSRNAKVMALSVESIEGL